jgi:hypothetical protein
MLKNLTGRALTIYPLTGDQPLCEVPPSGAAARVSVKMEPVWRLISHEECGVPLVRPVQPSAAELAAALPPPEEDVTLIVTVVVAPLAWAAGRTDVVHMGDAVFGPDGRTQIGARGLVPHPSLP